MGRHVRRALRACLILLAAIALFVASLTVVYSIPNARIIANARESVGLLESEGLYPMPLGNAGLMQDNFADALMLDIAIADSRHSAFVNAMGMYMQRGQAPLFTIDGLKRSVEERRTAPVQYAHYWHGYEVLLRPLLFFFSYGDIRYLNVLVLSLLSVLAALAVERSLGTSGLVAFTVALVWTGFYIVPMSLEFSPDVYLMLLGVPCVLELERRGAFDRVSWEFFALMGALTNFVDLLTAPLLTLGMPLAVLLLARARSKDAPARSAFGTIIVSSALWGAGYAITWVAKWLIAGPVIHFNVWQDALGAAAERSGGAVGSGGASLPRAYYHNLRLLMPLLRSGADGSVQGGWPTVLLVVFSVVALTAFLTAMLLRARRRGANLASTFQYRAPALLIAAFPLAWIAVLREHSTTHSWFTYRILAISIFVILSITFAGIETGSAQAELVEGERCAGT